MKNLKISSQLNLGFTLVIAILLLSAATAWRVEMISRPPCAWSARPNC
jgi:methyl-accepting chemotaxis protein